MKYAAERLLADPEKAARRLMEHAQAFEPIQDGSPATDHGAINCNARQCEVTVNAHLCERDNAAASLLVPPVS
jgi:hypothetical protein